LAPPAPEGQDRQNPRGLELGVVAELDEREHQRREGQPALDLVAQGGTQIVWEDRWHEEEIFANRLAFYLLAQSFLVFAAVEATLSGDAVSRWLPLALIIDLAGLILTLVFWYALTENLRRLDALKDIVAEGSPEMGIPGYREIGAIRTAHHERRSRRRLPFPLSILPRSSPSYWLAHGIPGLLGSMWIALIITAIVTAA
jgi:HAMP domain-containing protein